MARSLRAPLAALTALDLAWPVLRQLAVGQHGLAKGQRHGLALGHVLDVAAVDLGAGHTAMKVCEDV